MLPLLCIATAFCMFWCNGWVFLGISRNYAYLQYFLALVVSVVCLTQFFVFFVHTTSQIKNPRNFGPTYYFKIVPRDDWVELLMLQKVTVTFDNPCYLETNIPMQKPSYTNLVPVLFFFVTASYSLQNSCWLQSFLFLFFGWKVPQDLLIKKYR